MILTAASVPTDQAPIRNARRIGLKRARRQRIRISAGDKARAARRLLSVLIVARRYWDSVQYPRELLNFMACSVRCFPRSIRTEP